MLEALGRQRELFPLSPLSRFFPETTGGVPRRFEQGTDGIYEGASIGTQFNDPFFDYLLEEFLATREKLDQHLAPVFAAWGAFDVGVGFHAIDEFDGAVVTERKAIGESADGGLVPSGKAANCEEQEILLGLETRVAASGVAFLEEATDKAAELGQGAVFVGGDLVAHEYILSYDDTFEKIGRLNGGPAPRRVLHMVDQLR